MRRALLLVAALAVILPAVTFAGSFPDGPGGPNVAIINKSSVAQSAMVKYLPYFQQYADQICDSWHVCGHLYLASAPNTARDWTLTLNDTSDQAGAIGYHGVTKTGVPEGFASVKTAIQNGMRWGVVFTHEYAEMAADPSASLTANTACQGDPETGNAVNCTFVNFEVADPVQGESYRLGPITVSDFVYRSWFTPGSPGPFDAGRHLSAPMTLAPQSYMSIYENGTWQQNNTFDGARNWDAFGHERNL